MTQDHNFVPLVDIRPYDSTMKQTDAPTPVTPPPPPPPPPPGYSMDIKVELHRVRAELPRESAAALTSSNRICERQFSEISLDPDFENQDAIMCDLSPICWAAEEVRERALKALPFLPRNLDQEMEEDGSSETRILLKPRASGVRMDPCHHYASSDSLQICHVPNVSFDQDDGDEDDLEMSYSDISEDQKVMRTPSPVTPRSSSTSVRPPLPPIRLPLRPSPFLRSFTGTEEEQSIPVNTTSQGQIISEADRADGEFFFLTPPIEPRNAPSTVLSPPKLRTHEVYDSSDIGYAPHLALPQF